MSEKENLMTIKEEIMKNMLNMAYRCKDALDIEHEYEHAVNYAQELASQLADKKEFAQDAPEFENPFAYLDTQKPTTIQVNMDVKKEESFVQDMAVGCINRMHTTDDAEEFARLYRALLKYLRTQRDYAFHLKGLIKLNVVRHQGIAL